MLASFTEYKCSLQARSFLPSPSGETQVPLREHGLVDPQLRASNEHIPIVRVPRAGGQPGHAPPPLLSVSIPQCNFSPSLNLITGHFYQKLHEVYAINNCI